MAFAADSIIHVKKRNRQYEQYAMADVCRHYPIGKVPKTPGFVRSVLGDGSALFANRLDGVTAMGLQPLLIVEFTNEIVLRLTSGHTFLTDHGLISLSRMSGGTCVYGHGPQSYSAGVLCEHQIRRITPGPIEPTYAVSVARGSNHCVGGIVVGC